MTGSTGLDLAGILDFAVLRGFSAVGSRFVSGGAIGIDSVTGGTDSMTGRLTPTSANGTFHSKPSSRPFGDTGNQRSDTTPSAVQTGSPEARIARVIHSRTRPSSPCSVSSSSAINVATRRVGADK